jgi:HEAT repeat protein
MAGLIGARLLLGWRRRAREEERQRLVPILLGEGGDARPRLWLADDFLADLLIELIQLVRGSECERFVERAAALGVPDRLRHQLGSASARIRQAAAEALGYFGDAASVDALRGALADRNPDVRLTAALALAQAGRQPPLRELVRRLSIGGKEKSLLIHALFKEIARHDTAELEMLLRSRSAPVGARIAAAEALAEAGHYRAVPLIGREAMEADPAGPELPRYLRALGDLGHPAAAVAVERALASESPSARAAAAEAAGRIGLTPLAPRLRALLADPAWRVRFRAGEALIRLGPEGIETLREAAATAGPPRDAAGLILAERGLA